MPILAAPYPPSYPLDTALYPWRTPVRDYLAKQFGNGSLDVFVPYDQSFNFSIRPYAELYDVASRTVIAATTTVLDWEVTFESDAAGKLQATFTFASDGLDYTYSVDLNNDFDNPVIQVWPEDTRTTLANFADTLISGTMGPNDSSASVKRNLQLRFSIGERDFIDAKKMVTKTLRSSDPGKPILREDGNTYWDQYAKIVINRFTAQDAPFYDVLVGRFGQVTTLNYAAAAQVGITPATAGQVGYITNTGNLPYVGGLFLRYAPIAALTVNAQKSGSAPVGALPGETSFVKVNGDMLYFPIVLDELVRTVGGKEVRDYQGKPTKLTTGSGQALPVSIDINNDSFAKAMEATVKALAGIVNAAYVAHYAEDSSELYLPLIRQQIAGGNTGYTVPYGGANAFIIGQLFQSPCIFFSAAPYDSYDDDLNDPAEGTLPEQVGDAVSRDLKDADALDYYSESPMGFEEGTLWVDSGGTAHAFDVKVHAQIEKAISVEPDQESTYSSASFLGGTTNCGLPDGAQVNKVVMFNAVQSAEPSIPRVSWDNSVPLYAVSVGNTTGGLYAHIGDQSFTLVSPNVAVNDVVLDGNTVWIATDGGVYVNKNFSLNRRAQQTWSLLGGTGSLNDFTQAVQRLQLDSSRFHTGANPYLYAMSNGSSGSGDGVSLAGVYSYPMAHPTASPSGSHLTNAQTAAANDHAGWDQLLVEPNITDFALVGAQTLYYVTSGNLNTLCGLDVTSTTGSEAPTVTFPVLSILPGQDQIQRLIPLDAADVSLPGGGSLPLLIVLTNGVTTNIYYKTATNDTSSPSVASQNAARIDADGLFSPIPTMVNNIIHLRSAYPGLGTVQGKLVSAIACTDSGLYYSDRQAPNYNWVNMNSQNGMDAVNINWIAVGAWHTEEKPFWIDRGRKANDPATGGDPSLGYTCYYTPMACCNQSDIYESQSGGTWWVSRTQDTVSLANTFYDLWYNWVNRTYAARPNTGGRTPVPYPDFPWQEDYSAIQMQVSLQYDSGIYYTVPPGSPTTYTQDKLDLSQFWWVRERNEQGEFFFYLENRSATNLRQQRFASTASVLTTDDLLTIEEAAQQLGYLHRRWLLENSTPLIQVTVESGFADRRSILRFLRPFHIVHLDATIGVADAQGNVHYQINFPSRPMYVLSHTIKYGGDSDPRALTTTLLSTEMAKQRLTLDEMMADIQHALHHLHRKK